MHQDFDGTAETLGELYYRDLRSWVKDLHGSRLLVSAAFSSLHAEYDGVFPRSKLRLYARNRRLHGPTALYWGDAVAAQLHGPGSVVVFRYRPPTFIPGLILWALTVGGIAWVYARTRRGTRLSAPVSA